MAKFIIDVEIDSISENEMERNTAMSSQVSSMQLQKAVGVLSMVNSYQNLLDLQEKNMKQFLDEQDFIKTSATSLKDFSTSMRDRLGAQRLYDNIIKPNKEYINYIEDIAKTGLLPGQLPNISDDDKFIKAITKKPSSTLFPVPAYATKSKRKEAIKLAKEAIKIIDPRMTTEQDISLNQAEIEYNEALFPANDSTRLTTLKLIDRGAIDYTRTGRVGEHANKFFYQVIETNKEINRMDKKLKKDVRSYNRKLIIKKTANVLKSSIRPLIPIITTGITLKAAYDATSQTLAGNTIQAQETNRDMQKLSLLSTAILPNLNGLSFKSVTITTTLILSKVYSMVMQNRELITSMQTDLLLKDYNSKRLTDTTDRRWE